MVQTAATCFVWQSVKNLISQNTTKNKIISTLAILMVLIFSKYFYLTSISSYYTFYLIHKFGVSVQSAQIHLFVFLFAVAAGTIIGGPLGDKIGRKYVIWGSILGVALLPLLYPTRLCIGRVF